jgi:hypothetical protein
VLFGHDICASRERLEMISSLELFFFLEKGWMYSSSLELCLFFFGLRFAFLFCSRTSFGYRSIVLVLQRSLRFVDQSADVELRGQGSESLNGRLRRATSIHTETRL